MDNSTSIRYIDVYRYKDFIHVPTMGYSPSFREALKVESLEKLGGGFEVWEVEILECTYKDSCFFPNSIN